MCSINFSCKSRSSLRIFDRHYAVHVAEDRIAALAGLHHEFYRTHLTEHLERFPVQGRRIFGRHTVNPLDASQDARGEVDVVVGRAGNAHAREGKDKGAARHAGEQFSLRWRDQGHGLRHQAAVDQPCPADDVDRALLVAADADRGQRDLARGGHEALAEITLDRLGESIEFRRASAGTVLFFQIGFGLLSGILDAGGGADKEGVVLGQPRFQPGHLGGDVLLGLQGCLHGHPVA